MKRELAAYSSHGEKNSNRSLLMKIISYTDNRLVIPHIWWSRIHCEVIDHSRLCEQGLQSGKHLKCILRQIQVGKIEELKQRNEEVALDFAGPFQNAKKGIKYMLVSIDHFPG